MTKEELYAHPGWQWCTSEGAELHTLLMGLRPPSAKSSNGWRKPKT